MERIYALGVDARWYNHCLVIIDAAQAFLPPVKAIADIIPGVGSIIKGAIGGTLSVLQLVDVIRPLSRVSLLMLNLAIIEIHPEQGRPGEAHPSIAHASPPYRQCTHRSDYR